MVNALNQTMSLEKLDYTVMTTCHRSYLIISTLFKQRVRKCSVRISSFQNFLLNIYCLHPFLWNSTCEEYSDKHQEWSLFLTCRKVLRVLVKILCSRKFTASGVASGGKLKGYWTCKSLKLRHTTYMYLICGTMTFSASFLTMKYPGETNRTSVPMRRQLMEILITYTHDACNNSDNCLVH
jgi:hypothetical protein